MIALRGSAAVEAALTVRIEAPQLSLSVPVVQMGTNGVWVLEVRVYVVGIIRALMSTVGAYDGEGYVVWEATAGGARNIAR